MYDHGLMVQHISRCFISYTTLPYLMLYVELHHGVYPHFQHETTSRSIERDVVLVTFSLQLLFLYFASLLFEGRV